MVVNPDGSDSLEALRASAAHRAATAKAPTAVKKTVKVVKKTATTLKPKDKPGSGNEFVALTSDVVVDRSDPYFASMLKALQEVGNSNAGYRALIHGGLSQQEWVWSIACHLNPGACDPKFVFAITPGFRGNPPGDKFVVGKGFAKNGGMLQLPAGMVSAAGIVITQGKNFRKHFLDHKSLLRDVTGKTYRKLDENGPEFLQDLTDMVNNGELVYQGVGTIPGRQPADSLIFRGHGLTLVTYKDGTFHALVKSGRGWTCISG